MRNPAVRIPLAVVFGALGIVGLLMPVMPGWIFFGAAALLLFPDSPLSRSSADRIERHFPFTRHLVRRLVPDRDC